MAENTTASMTNHPFHPTDPPHGLRNFDLGALGKDQQRSLNVVKMRRRIENEIYLKAHPEVRGLISILLKHILSKKPTQDVHQTVGSFFMRSRSKLIADLLEYFTDNEITGSTVEKLRNEAAAEATGSSSHVNSNCSSSLTTSEEST